MASAKRLFDIQPDAAEDRDDVPGNSARTKRKSQKAAREMQRRALSEMGCDYDDEDED